MDPLEAFVDEGIVRSVRLGYNPTTFQRMRRDQGTVVAITKLVQSGDMQSGFRRLADLGLLEWSIEAAVMKFPERFSIAAHECAEFRMRLVAK